MANWEDYDDPSTAKKFAKTPGGAAVAVTTYASNDELFALLDKGHRYDVIVPSQNAVVALRDSGKLLPLEHSLLPNLANLDPLWRNLIYDPGNEFSVVKNYGITTFWYRNDIVHETPRTWPEFYDLIPRYGARGGIGLLDSGEEIVPLALAALGHDMNSNDPRDLADVRALLRRIAPYIAEVSSDWVDDAVSGKLVMGQGWTGDVVSLTQQRKDITVVMPDGRGERWADNWAIPHNAPDPEAGHAWINYLLRPDVAAVEMQYNGYPTPVAEAMAKLPPALRNNPVFNPSDDVLRRYGFVFNLSPTQQRDRERIADDFTARIGRPRSA